jgi:hypothetical protein
MKAIHKLILFSFVIIIFAMGCKKDQQQIDTEPPVIDISTNSFPVQCSILTRGEKVVFKAKFSDNAALGSYSIDIHQNFDHHTHSTEVANCTLDPIKAPVKPFLFINTFQLPEGKTVYEANTEITIPSDIDPGDYHFLIKLTDKEGWQTIKGISIKIK